MWLIHACLRHSGAVYQRFQTLGPKWEAIWFLYNKMVCLLEIGKVFELIHVFTSRLDPASSST